MAVALAGSLGMELDLKFGVDDVIRSLLKNGDNGISRSWYPFFDCVVLSAMGVA